MTSDSGTLIPYDSLLAFPDTDNRVELLRKVNNLLKETTESQWNEKINGLNILRRLFKYEKDFFNKVMYDLDIKEILGKLINSIRTTLSKAALTFLKELFSEYEFEYNDNNEQIELVSLVEFFIPKIIVKALSDKGFLRDEAGKCLNEVSKNMLYGKTLIILLNECSDKNQKHSDIAYTHLLNIISNFERNYLNYYENWDKIFSNLAKIFKMKKDSYLKKPGKVIILFEEMLGKERFSEIMRTQCKEEDKDSINKAIEYYKIKVTDKGINSLNNTTTKSIKDFIKESKQKTNLKKDDKVDTKFDNMITSFNL